MLNKYKTDCMDKLNILLLICVVFLLLLLIPFNFVFSGTSNSTYNFFNVTNLTYFNWTSTNITIGSYNDSIQMSVDNETTGIYPMYSQTTDVIQYYTDTQWETCFPGLDNNVSFLVQRQDGTYTNLTTTLNLSDIEEFMIRIHPFCPPGKYYGYFNVTRVGNSTDRVEVYSSVDIPLSLNNTFNSTGNKAYFKGTISVNDTYHSYYFNTSELKENITGLTLTLTELSDDVDLFLFDNMNVLRGKSIERGTLNEQIVDIDLPSLPSMWEIRVYGNVSSSYTGYLYFSTLNVTNSTSPDISIDSLDYGTLNPNTTSSKRFTLKNEDDRILFDVYEYSEIYHVNTWNLKNTSQDFNLLVPNFTQKMKVKIEWFEEPSKNITDWDLYLTDPDGNVVGNSTNKFINSNVTNSTREEYIIFTGPFDTKEGFWNISVRNQTNSDMPLSYYNVTAYLWMDSDSWISTNYTNGFDFNSSEYDINTNITVEANLTIPERKILDGQYTGFLKYNNSEGWNTIIPISFNVSAGILIINNTIGSMTTTLKDNIGFNRVGNDALIITMTFNNTGSYPIYYTNNTSSILRLDNDSNITFTVDWPQNPIDAGSSGRMNITLSINTTQTGNDIGVYRGWIFFNTTNTTLTSSSYPYKTFNLSLELNLTDELNVVIDQVKTADGNNMIETPSNDENITFVTRVYLINGTQLTDPGESVGIDELYVENFTVAWMNETNVTSEGVSLQNISQERLGSTWLCYGSPLKCYINITVPSNRVGGRYRLSLKVQWNTTESLLTGIGTYQPLIINNTGLYLTTITSKSISVNEGGNVAYYNVSVVNYGPLNAGGNLTMSSCSYATIEAYAANDSKCYSSRSGRSFLFDSSDSAETVDGNGTEVCEFSWKITSTNNVTGDKTCSGIEVVASDVNFGSITGISITIRDTDTDEEEEGDGGLDGGDESTTTTTTTSTTTTILAEELTYLDIVSYPSMIFIPQGESNITVIKVKNTNETIDQNVTLSIENINSTWYTIIPNESVVIESNETKSFTIKFFIPNETEIKTYEGKFKASSEKDVVYANFTLRVEPNESKKVEINNTFLIIESKILSLENDLNQTKEKGYNTTEVESKFAELKQKLQNAKDAISRDDYFTAYQLIGEMETLLNETRIKLEEAKSVGGDGIGWLKWVLMVLGVIGIGLLVYLFWPVEEKPKTPSFLEAPRYDMKRKKFVFKPKSKSKEKKNILEKLKEFLDKLISRKKDIEKQPKTREDTVLEYRSKPNKEN